MSRAETIAGGSPGGRAASATAATKAAAPRGSLAVLSLAPLANDARVLREIRFGARERPVEVVAGGPMDEDVAGVRVRVVPRHRFRPLSRALQALLLALGRLSPRFYERWYWRRPDHGAALAELIAARPALIHANEVMSLPLALRAREVTGAAVLFDAHEYGLDHWPSADLAGRLTRPLHRWLLQAHAPRADAMITVAPGLAARFDEALPLPRPCGVVRNAPSYQQVPFRPCAPGRLRLVHPGAAQRKRRLEDLVDVVAASAPGVELSFLLLPQEPDYLRELQAYAAERAPGRVHFQAPVRPAEVVDALRAYDVGLLLLPPLDTSYEHCLPNKLFDCMMAGLAVAIGPSPEMARVLRARGCGVVAEGYTPAAVAAALAALKPEDIDRMKAASLSAARELNAETEMARLQALYGELLASETAS